MTEGTNQKGVLIAIEGISGAGKSRLASTLKAELANGKKDILVLGGFEVHPYSSPLTAFLRAIVQEHHFIGFPLICETHLLIAEIMHDIETLMTPSLANGQIIVYDSYLDSIIAFQSARALLRQSYNAELTKKYLKEVLETLLNSALVPTAHCTIYIECSINRAAARIEARDGMPITSADLELQSEIARQYHSLMGTKEHLTIENTEDSTWPDSVNQVVEYIKQKLPGLFAS